MMPRTIGLPGSRPAAAQAGDAVDALLACHARIRHYLAVNARLVDASPVRTPAEQLAEAAAGIARYFTVALPLHSTDEDLSVRPRLEALAAAREVRALLSAMSDEHELIHRIIDGAAPLWREIAVQPVRLRDHRAELGRAGTELEALFQRHLAPEEEVLFPALRRHLDAAALAELHAEMRARREPLSG